MKAIEKAFLEKDEKACEVLYRKYFRLLEFLALEILQDPSEAEDVAQESFLKAFLHSKEYTQEVSFLAWLCRIAKNEALDRLRKRRWTVPLDEEKINAVPDSPSPSRKADESLLLERVKSILSPEDYSLVILRVYFRLPYKEIALLLSSTAAQLVPRYDRAIKKLRKTLGGK